MTDVAVTNAHVDKLVFRALVSVNMVVAVDVLAMLLILPIIDTLSQSLGASKAMIGTLFTVYSSCALLSTFIMGRISDKYGRRTIFLLSAFGSLCASIGCILVVNFTQFLIVSALSGCFTGTVGTAYAYIADIVQEPKKRAKYISYVTATLASCLVLGPLVGGVVSIWYLRGPFFISASMALLELLLVYGYLKSPRELIELQKQQHSLLPADEDVEQQQQQQQAEDVSSSGAELESLTAAAAMNPMLGAAEQEEPANEMQKPLLGADDEEPVRSAWFDYRAVLVGGLGVFLNTVTYLGLVSLVPLILQEDSFGIVSDDTNDELSDHDISRISFLMGTYLGVFGLVQVFCILMVFPKVQKHLGMLSTGALGCFIYGVTFCMVPFIHHTGYMYAIFGCMGVGNALSRPTFPAYLGSIAHPKKKAEYMSVTATCGNLAMVFGGQMTLLYSYQANAAVLMAGLLSIANAAMIVTFSVFHPSKPTVNS